jgi:hypothetical protein
MILLYVILIIFTLKLKITLETYQEENYFQYIFHVFGVLTLYALLKTNVKK